MISNEGARREIGLHAARCGQFAASPIHSHHSASICALFAMQSSLTSANSR